MKKNIHETLDRLNRKYSHYGSVYDFSKDGSHEDVNIPWNVAKLIALERDEYKCRVCGNSPLISENKDGFDKLRVEVEVHHIVPRIAGGTDSTKNLITLCKSCHIKTFKNNYSGLPYLARGLNQSIEILTNSKTLLTYGSGCEDHSISNFYYRGGEITLKEPLDCKMCRFASLKRVYDIVFNFSLDIEEIVIKDKNKEFCVGIIEK